MDALRATVVSGINTLLFNLLLMLGAVAMILSLADWKLFLAVAWLAPLLAGCNFIYRRKIARQWQEVRAGYSRLASNWRRTSPACAWFPPSTAERESQLLQRTPAVNTAII